MLHWREGGLRAIQGEKVEKKHWLGELVSHCVSSHALARRGRASRGSGQRVAAFAAAHETDVRRLLVDKLLLYTVSLHENSQCLSNC